VLREAAQRLAGAARTVDSVGRFGGEEFAWLLPDASPGEALAAAHRLAEALRAQPFGDEQLRLTASIGVCDLGSAGSADLLLERADAALYWAKAHGRDAVVAWTAETARRLAVARTAGGSREQRLAALAALAEETDPTASSGHGRRVAELAVALAGRLDWPPAQQARLHQAALLHDLGKVLVPTEVLAKPGPLDATEVVHVRQHAAFGAAMAAAVLDREQCSWVLGHHERRDGGGYPAGLAGDRLPPGAQLLGLADTWDAMTHDRPHRSALPVAQALAEVDREAGSRLMPGAGALVRDALRWLSAA
jgi:HD-GYP domain-containing protein (c-di-GMP phosphodiesterase class II)